MDRTKSLSYSHPSLAPQVQPSAVSKALTEMRRLVFAVIREQPETTANLAGRNLAAYLGLAPSLFACEGLPITMRARLLLKCRK